MRALSREREDMRHCRIAAFVLLACLGGCSLARLREDETDRSQPLPTPSITSEGSETLFVVWSAVDLKRGELLFPTCIKAVAEFPVGTALGTSQVNMASLGWTDKWDMEVPLAVTVVRATEGAVVATVEAVLEGKVHHASGKLLLKRGQYWMALLPDGREPYQLVIVGVEALLGK